MSEIKFEKLEAYRNTGRDFRRLHSGSQFGILVTIKKPRWISEDGTHRATRKRELP